MELIGGVPVEEVIFVDPEEKFSNSFVLLPLLFEKITLAMLFLGFLEEL